MIDKNDEFDALTCATVPTPHFVEHSETLTQSDHSLLPETVAAISDIKIVNLVKVVKTFMLLCLWRSSSR